jgi:hypothetical protein
MRSGGGPSKGNGTLAAGAYKCAEYIRQNTTNKKKPCRQKLF